jgi:hypothetical protein
MLAANSYSHFDLRQPLCFALSASQFPRYPRSSTVFCTANMPPPAPVLPLHEDTGRLMAPNCLSYLVLLAKRDCSWVRRQLLRTELSQAQPPLGLHLPTPAGLRLPSLRRSHPPTCACMSWVPSRRLTLWLRERPQGLLNVGTLSARMAVLRSCALDI